MVEVVVAAKTRTPVRDAGGTVSCLGVAGQVRKGTPCRIQGSGVVEVLYGKNPRGSGKK